jgi:chromosome segregation ATPase
MSDDTGIQTELDSLRSRVKVLTAENAELISQVSEWRARARKYSGKSNRAADRLREAETRLQQAANLLHKIEGSVRARAVEQLISAWAALEEAQLKQRGTEEISALEALVLQRKAELEDVERLMTIAGDGQKHARHRTGQDNHLELGFPHSDPARTVSPSPIRKTLIKDKEP